MTERNSESASASVDSDDDLAKTVSAVERPSVFTGISTRRSLAASLVVFGILLGVGLLRLLVPFPAGLADNGDGKRYTCQVGITTPETARYVDFAVFEWSPGVEAACGGYPSSEVLVLEAAKVVTSWLGGASGSVDLTVVMVGYALLVALVCAICFSILRAHLILRSVAVFLLFVIMMDSTFAGYAGSVYGEFPGIAGMVLLTISGVLIGLKGPKKWIGLSLFVAASLLLLTSKTQAITLLLPISMFLLFHSFPLWKTKTERNGCIVRLVRHITGRIAPVAVVLALIVPTAWVFNNNPKDFQWINSWEVISVSLLTRSGDPLGDLKEMGMGPEMLQYAGKSVWAEGGAVSDADLERNRHRMNYSVVFQFLLAHPDRALSIANHAAVDYWNTRPNYLGAFAKESGVLPGTLDSRLTLVPMLALPREGLGLPGLVVFWLLLSILGVFGLKNSAANSLRRSFVAVALLMISFSIIQFVTATFGEAIENTKHMVYGIMAGAVVFPLLLCSAIADRVPAGTMDKPDTSGAGESGSAS